MCDDDAGSDEVVITRRRGADPESKRKGRGSGGGASKRQRVQSAAQDDWGDIVLAPRGRAAICDAEQARAQAQQAGCSAIVAADAEASAASFPNEAQPQAAGSGAVVAVADSGGGVADREERFFAILEGVQVRQDGFGVLGQPGTYRRLVVKCPHHGSKSSLCGSSRKFDLKDKKVLASGLGDLEPYAFLGCWLAKASDYASKKEHGQYRPTVAETQAYAREKLGWSG